ncbi:sushi, von Willebrand factor type A, EGF and pentraxin domain-containing protein 1-like [Mercenaria mercenaria]|uniref:sushi, von Willebrand factor type A, EGF and pentraxin domain-containing protein 1-like n=1 Tax=Mercenaria mercenaria TaxID=6596 RepID=UPI00234E6BE2|nr:sushi, von Willebrand factor type A, EGF and pentraxin domain-containing protein 1-like [Mercenaria mercenaria]
MSGTSSRICQPDGSWSGREPSCSPRDCGQLFNSINGFVNVSMGTTFGSVATYSCREGYSLVGQGTSQCNYTGTWNPPVTPTCVVIDCGILVDPQFGSVALSQGTRFKSLATYRCDTGYELRGPTSRECLSTGKWSNVQSQTSCSRVDCSELQAPINGIITYTAGTSLGSQAIFDCDHGFYMTGSNISLCSEGSWTHTTPLCTLQDCGSIAQPVDGSVSLTNGTVFNSIAEFTCNTGYRLSGPRMRTCSDSGKWKPKQGTKCLLYDCGMLQNPVNGNVDQSSGTTYGQTVQFSCSVGYEIFGSSQAICMADGTWSNAAPLCQVTDCGGLSSPDNGLVSASQTTFGQVATYTCAEGYSLSGTSSRICQPDGSWSSSPPLCLVKDCGSLPDPVFGRVEYSSSLYGSVAVYRCDVGYSLQGVSGRNCAADGRWSGTTPTCITIDCGTLSSIRFGSYKPPQRNVYGTTVTISCDTGYRLNGNATVTCLQTSQWSPLPSCVIRDCGDLSRPDNGLVSLPGGTTYGQTALFSCQTGYLPTGPTELQCTEDGIWNGSPPACQHADCGILSDPMNGGVTISGTKFGAYATYVCDAGHQITGSPSRLCQEDGTWSGSSPSCIVRDCGQLTAPARGNVSVPSGTTYGNIAKFSCNEKYDLVGLSAVVCRADGTWSAQPPVCTLKDGLISKDLTIRLNMTAPPGLTLSNPFTYNAYQLEVKTVLTQHYGTIMKDGIVDIIVNSLQLGSLIVDYTVVLQDSEGAVKDFTEASLRLALGSTLEVFNENLGVNRMTVDDSLVNLLSLSAEELACRLFLEMSGPCQTGYICTLVANSPECRPDPSTDCGIPANPSNGAVDYSRGTLFGDTVIYTCNSGYTLVGHNTRTCQGGGNWAPDAPTCSLTDCGTLSDLANGLVVFGGTVIGQTAFYSCNPGYSLIGASVVTCQLDGTWSNPPPTCRITGCGGLSNPLHGTVTVSTDGSVAQYTCQTGFYLTGDSLRTCLVSKLWSGSAPTCRAVECFNLPDPLNGRVDITGTSYGSTATYHCTRVGYKMSGPDTRVCGQDGQWSGNAPSCDIIECDVLPPLPSGNIDMLDRTYGQTVSFTCNQGYILQGAQTLTCMASGWSGTPPICRSSGDCGSLDNPMYGYVTFSLGTAFLSKATFSCYVGYKLTGSTERVCQADNTWSGTPTTCILVDCGQPVSSDGGRVTYTSGTTYGRVATYTCNSGYDLIGPATVTCQNNGTWTYKPICRAKDCGSPPNPLNGLVDIVAGTTFGSTAVYTCNPGYYRQGASARTCLATGYWDNLVPTCVVRDCGPLATPTHGVVNVPLGTTYGQTATYYCNPGYTLSGTASRQCAVDGLWTGFSPVCIGVVCGSLSRPGNGQVSLSQGLGVGSVATYTCNPGYVLSPANNAARTCKMNGTWTGTPPVCIFIDCGSLSAPMFGEIVIDQTTFGHKALYTCNQGYMMSGSKERRCNTDGYWSGTRPVCTVTDCGSLNHPDNGKVMMPEGTLFGHTAVYKCNSGYTLKNYYKRTCQSNGTWSGAAPSCESSREFALAVGLGVGLTGFVILVMVIVLIVVILYRRNHSKHYGRMSRMYTFPRPVTVPPPLPVKINTGPTMFVPFYNGPAVVDDDSNISDRHTTWRSRKADYGDPANPLYYNTTMPGAEYYSFHR